MLGVSVLENVVERLLRDPIQLLLSARLQPLALMTLKVRNQARPRLNSVKAYLEGTRETALLEQRRPKVEQQEPHLSQRFLRRIAYLGNVRSNAIEVPCCECLASGLGIQ